MTSVLTPKYEQFLFTSGEFIKQPCFKSAWSSYPAAASVQMMLRLCAGFTFPLYDGSLFGYAQLVRCIPNPNAQNCNSPVFGTYNVEVYGATGGGGCLAGVSLDPLQDKLLAASGAPMFCWVEHVV
jgi:hypothetical protein